MNRTRRADPRKADHPVPLGAESRSRPTDDWLAPLNLMNEWQKEGHEKGLQEGRLKEALRSLGIVLRVRFGEVPEALHRQLQALEDPETLEALLERAASSPSLADFRSALPEPQ